MKILIDPHPLLHEVMPMVTTFNDSLIQEAEKMRQTMHQSRGIGLAAPQVGLRKQLLVIEYVPNDKMREEGEEEIPFLAITNPKVVWKSTQEIILVEGCLSVPGYEGEVRRPRRVKIKAQDLLGDQITIKASGLLARVLQHEIDHLNGILYTSRLVPGTTLKPIQAEYDL